MSHELSQYLLGNPVAVARTVLVMLIALLSAAAWYDVRQHRIPNVLVAWGAMLAILLHVLIPAGDGFVSYSPGGLGLSGACGGLALGALALLPLYALGAMGAGDVKLVAMVGAFLGPQHLVGALFATVVAGGALAIAVAMQRRLLLRVLQNLRLMLWNGLLKLNRGGAAAPQFGVSTLISLPFGVAIAVGSTAYLVLRARLLGLI